MDRRLLTTGFVIAALAVAGCGSSKSSKQASTPPAPTTSATSTTTPTTSTTHPRSETRHSTGHRSNGGTTTSPKSKAKSTPTQRKTNSTHHTSGGKKPPTPSHHPARKKKSTSAPVGDAKARFIARGDSICIDFRKKKAALGPQPSNTQARADWYDKTGDLVANAVAQFRAPPPPPADGADTLNSYVSTLSDQVGLLHKLADATRRNDARAQFDDGKQIDQNSAKASNLAHQYGFQVCGT